MIAIRSLGFLIVDASNLVRTDQWLEAAQVVEDAADRANCSLFQWTSIDCWLLIQGDITSV